VSSSGQNGVTRTWNTHGRLVRKVKKYWSCTSTKWPRLIESCSSRPLPYVLNEGDAWHTPVQCVLQRTEFCYYFVLSDFCDKRVQWNEKRKVIDTQSTGLYKEGRISRPHYEGVWGGGIYLHSFLTPALDEGEWSASRLGHFTPVGLIIMCSAVTACTVVTGLHKMYLFECEQSSHRRLQRICYVRQMSGRQGSNVTIPLSNAYWSQSL
jgi:hypothetical protein